MGTCTLPTHSGKELEFIAPLRTKMPEQPVDTVDMLREELQKAIEEENFEHAAELRDRIHEIEGRHRT